MSEVRGPEREGIHIERALSLLYAASAILEDIPAGILILAMPPFLAPWEALRLKDRYNLQETQGCHYWPWMFVLETAYVHCSERREVQNCLWAKMGLEPGGNPSQR